jgi:hypothetical protein
MFNWIEFLEQNHVEYSQKRHNISRNNIGINCPFCGNDTGFNLHISLNNRGWHCWKDNSHKGLTPHRLLQQLLQCSYSEAASLLGGDAPLSSDIDYVQYINNILNPQIKTTYKSKPKSLEIPKEFHPIQPIGSGHLFVNYLKRRGFLKFCDFTSQYDIYMVLGGRFTNRLVFVIKMDGKPVVWTGRLISEGGLRYLTLSIDDDPPALIPIKQTILWYDKLKYNDGTLVVCEGPFDALKINYLGNKHGIYATCLFNMTISDEQLDLLESLKYFKKRVIMFDYSYYWKYIYMTSIKNNAFSRLNQLGYEYKILDKSIKDPAELTEESFNALFLC